MAAGTRLWPCYGDLEHWGTSRTPPLFVGRKAAEGGQTFQEVGSLSRERFNTLLRKTDANVVSKKQ
ncbi:hypothetical protein K0M31_010564 [Melipona bicolor]|uniref:Uncharacterized protein n=1 Tax=Melipona bicolor TaxID=60889 RepID=A0AA40FM95_9HYME|nr:hypothetical protein K0M31_010564 [Melipona bicolor]